MTPRIAPLALLLVATPLAAQPSAPQVLDRAIAAYERMMSGVENYTITQEISGFETTTYFERRPGTPEYDVYVVTAGGLEREDDEFAGASGGPPPAEMLRAMRQQARSAGSETIDGVRTYGVRVEDFGALAAQYGAMPPVEEDDGAMDLDAATFYFGADDGLIRRAVMEGTVSEDGRTTPIRMEMTFEDLREVGGMRYPFLTRMRMTGMEGAVSAAEQAEMRQGLAEARRQLEQLPPAQREMMERMLGEQLQQVEGMMEGRGFETTMRVTSLRVNEGRPR